MKNNNILDSLLLSGFIIMYIVIMFFIILIPDMAIKKLSQH